MIRVTNSRRQPQDATAGTGYERVWSRVWEWPIPPGVYVDPEIVREYLEEEARAARR